MPVQAAVMTLGFSMLPQLTITGGRGYSIVPGFQVIFAIVKFSCQIKLILFSITKPNNNNVQLQSEQGGVLFLPAAFPLSGFFVTKL